MPIIATCESINSSLFSRVSSAFFGFSCFCETKSSNFWLWANTLLINYLTSDSLLVLLVVVAEFPDSVGFRDDDGRLLIEVLGFTKDFAVSCSFCEWLSYSNFGWSRLLLMAWFVFCLVIRRLRLLYGSSPRVRDCIVCCCIFYEYWLLILLAACYTADTAYNNCMDSYPNKSLSQVANSLYTLEPISGQTVEQLLFIKSSEQSCYVGLINILYNIARQYSNLNKQK